MIKNCNNCEYKCKENDIEYCNNSSLKQFIYDDLKIRNLRTIPTSDGKRYKISDLNEKFKPYCPEWEIKVPD